MFPKFFAFALAANGLLACLWITAAQAQNSEAQSSEIAQGDETRPVADGTAADLWITPRFSADFNSPRNGDDGNSFSRVNAFVPLFQTPGRNLTFLSTSARLDSRGNLGGNVSLGHRFELDEDMILGGYIAYDIRDSGSRTFNQIGLGAELFGNNWNAHLNGYIPVGTSSAQVGGVTNTNQVTNAFFQNNQLFLVTGGLQEFESALGSVDVGAGLRLGDFGPYGSLWGYGNAYYIDDSLGGSLRLDQQIADRFRVGLGVQSDGIFGTQVFFSVGTSFGGTPKPALFANESEETRSPVTPWAQVAAADITRNNSIVVRQEMRGVPSETIVATDATTGNPLRFLHVNPTTGTAGGSAAAFESPRNTVANTIPLAGANDIIYVQAGAAGPGFTIPDNVQVLSAGPTQSITTQLGSVQLPGSGVGTLPTLSSTVTLGSNTTLSGFEITPIGATAGVTGNNTQTVTVINNTINGGNNAINLTNASGQIEINNNQINNPTARGVSLATNGGGTTTINTNNNIVNINAISVDGFRYQLNDTNVNLTMANNQITFDGGIVIPDPTNADGDGIDIETSGTTQLTFNINNNQVTNSVNAGIEIELCGFPTVCNGQVPQGIISDNTITNAGGDGILFFQNSTNNATVEISRNSLTNIGVEQTGSTNNFANPLLPLTGAGGLGIGVNTFSDGDLVLVVQDNVINTTQDEKIAVSSNLGGAGTSRIDARIQGNQLSGTGGNALTNQDVSVISANGSTLCLQLQNNTSVNVGNAYVLSNGLSPIVPVGNAFLLQTQTGNAGTVFLNPSPPNGNITTVGAVCNLP